MKATKAAQPAVVELAGRCRAFRSQAAWIDLTTPNTSANINPQAGPGEAALSATSAPPAIGQAMIEFVKKTSGVPVRSPQSRKMPLGLDRIEPFSTVA
jgi:hypothetical protein